MTDQEQRPDWNLISNLFGGVETWDETLPPELNSRIKSSTDILPDPLRARKRAANVAYLSAMFKRKPAEIEPVYEAVGSQYMSKALKATGDFSDDNFYAAVQASLGGRGQEATFMNKLSEAVIRQVAAGSDVRESLNAQMQAMSREPGFVADHRDTYALAVDAGVQHTKTLLASYGNQVKAISEYMLFDKQKGAAWLQSDYAAKRELAVRAASSIPKGLQRDMALDIAAIMAGDPEAAEGSLQRSFNENVGRSAQRGVNTMFRNLEGTVFEALQAAPVLEVAAWASSNEQDMRVIDQIERRVAGKVDPMEGPWYKWMWYSTAESIPRMAALATVVGIPIELMVSKDELVNEMLANGVPKENAEGLAMVGAVPYTAINWLQSRMLFKGKLPGFTGFLERPVMTNLQLLGKAGVVGGIEFTEQFIQEVAQDQIGTSMQWLGAAMDEAVPDVNVGEWLEQIGAESPRTALAMIPLVLFSTGSATFRDGAYGRQFVRSSLSWRALGFKPETIEEILAQPTLAEAQRVAMDNLDNREFGTEQKAAMAQLEENAERLNVNGEAGSVVRNDDGTFTVTDNQGNLVATTRSAEMAGASLDAVQNEQREAEQTMPAASSEVMPERDGEPAPPPSVTEEEKAPQNATGEPAQATPEAQAAAEEAQTPQERVEALNKAAIAGLRKQLGMEQLPKPKRQRWESLLNQALQTNAAARAEAIAADINANPRAISAEEHVAMLVKLAEVHNSYDQTIAEATLMAENGMLDRAASLQTQADALLQSIDSITDASQRTGTEIGRALAVRRMAVNRDNYTLAKIIQRARLAKKESLTQPELEQLTKLASEIKEATARIAQLEKEAAEAEKQLIEAKAAQFVDEKRTTKRRRPKTVAERRSVYVKRLRDLGYGKIVAEAAAKNAIPTKTGGMSEASLRMELEEQFGALSDRVTIEYNPDAKYAGYIEGGQIVLNSARIAPGTAAGVLLEEGLHGVWNAPDVQAAWEEWRQSVTQADIDEERRLRANLDTNEDVLREEAAIRRLLENRPKSKALMQRLWDAIVAAFKRVFGMNVETNRDTLMRAARNFIMSRMDAQQGEQRFATPTAQTETPEFKRWFGASKVVDAQGRPLVVYHGTGLEAFTQFHEIKPNFFTASREYAESYVGGKKTKTGRLMRVYLAIDNALDTRKEEHRRIFNEEFIPWVRRKGWQKDRFGDEAVLKFGELIPFTHADLVYPFLRAMWRDKKMMFDGYLVDERFGDYPPSWVPLFPEQIKSATGNSGAFDPANPDIRFAVPPTDSQGNAQPDDVANDVGLSAEASSLISGLAETFIEEGATTLSDVVGRIQSVFQELTESDIYAALGGRIKKERLKLATEAKKRLGEMKKQAALWAKIHEALDNKFDKKVEHKSSERVRMLRSIFAELRAQAFRTVREAKQLEAISKKIDAVQDQIEGGFRWIPEPEAASKENADIEAKKQELAEVRAEMRKMDKLAEIEDQLATGRRPEKDETPEQTNARLAELQAQINAVRKQIRDVDTMEVRRARLKDREKELRAAISEGRTIQPTKRPTTKNTVDVQQLQETVRELKRLMRTNEAIADLRSQIASGTYKQHVPMDRTIKSEDLERAIMERRRLQSKVNGHLDTMKRRTLSQRAVAIALVPRTIMATGDMSGVLRQGLILSISKPGAAASAFRQAFGAFFDSRTAEQVDIEMRRHPNQLARDKSGLFLAELDHGMSSREESFLSNLAEKIPGFGRIVKASNRHMVVYLNLLRVASFDTFIEDHPEATPEQRQAFARYINYASGRGSLGRFNAATRELNAVFFAPRWAVSRFQVIASPFMNWRDPLVRNAIVKDLLKTGAVGMVVMALARAAGAEVGDDPSTSDFGKIVIGDTRVDIWGSLLQPMRLILSPIINGMQSYEVDPMEFEKDVDSLDAFFRFTGYKFSPAVSVPIALVRRQNAVGGEQEPLETIARGAVPLTVQETWDTYWADESLGAASSTFALQWFGVGVQTQEPR